MVWSFKKVNIYIPSYSLIIFYCLTVPCKKRWGVNEQAQNQSLVKYLSLVTQGTADTGLQKLVNKLAKF